MKIKLKVFQLVSVQLVRVFCNNLTQETFQNSHEEKFFFQQKSLIKWHFIKEAVGSPSLKLAVS